MGFVPGRGKQKSGWDKHIEVKDAKQPIKIDFPLEDGVPDEGTMCAYHNRDADKWVQIDRCQEPAEQGFISCCTDHLSRFALVRITTQPKKPMGTLEEIMAFENGVAGYCLTLALSLSFICFVFSAVLECSTTSRSNKKDKPAKPKDKTAVELAEMDASKNASKTPAKDSLADENN